MTRPNEIRDVVTFHNYLTLTKLAFAIYNKIIAVFREIKKKKHTHTHNENDIYRAIQPTNWSDPLGWRPDSGETTPR